MLDKLLREELAGIEALQTLLQQEYHALRSRDVASLERLAREKQASADQLRGLDSARTAYVQQQGFAADRHGLQACVNAAPTCQEQAILQKLLAELESAAEQARNQNEINGAVIAASRGHIEQMLAIVSGRDSLEFLYGHDSRKVYNAGSGGGHTIGKA
ncbi:MAG: flagellar biosynthesis protein FlgN [Pseudomonadota bacterium]|nr:flagellar biosynthesis protein FlgN [Pseudomonadota bacterium]